MQFWYCLLFSYLSKNITFYNSLFKLNGKILTELKQYHLVLSRLLVFPIARCLDLPVLHYKAISIIKLQVQNVFSSKYKLGSKEQTSLPPLMKARLSALDVQK